MVGLGGDDGITDRDYTYSPAGRLLTRTWERGITTTYTYDNGGRLTLTNYSDSTRPVAIAYDALGRQTSVSNTIATSTYGYDPANLALDTETITYDLNTDGTPELARVFDRSQDTLRRHTGWTLKESGPLPPTEHTNTYGYEATTGRFSTVADSTSTHAYGYLPGSNLLATVTSPVHLVTNTYEASRDVLSTKVNSRISDNSIISSIGYTVNDLGQRTNATRSGAATNATAWKYDALGQLIEADDTIPTADRAYQYDALGNRLKSADSLTLPPTNNYTPNALNQYTAAPTFSSPSYDDDGNLLADGTKTHTWDGENRLLSVAGATYQYDAQSRRIAKTTAGVYPSILAP